MMARMFEYIDEFIVDTCPQIGCEFTRSQVKEWAEEKGYTFDIGRALDSHRKMPPRKLENGRHEGRVFTTERVGMGPKSKYRVVENQKGVAPTAVLRMHEQQASELVRRWRVEIECRMRPIANRQKNANVALKMAEAEIKAVAALLHARLEYGEENDS